MSSLAKKEEEEEEIIMRVHWASPKNEKKWNFIYILKGIPRLIATREMLKKKKKKSCYFMSAFMIFIFFHPTGKKLLDPRAMEYIE